MHACVRQSTLRTTMPISKLLLAVVPALALLPATVRTNRGPAPLRTATLETVVEPPEEPRNTSGA